MSAVSIKRKIRDVFVGSPYGTELLKAFNLSADDYRVLESFNRGFPEESDPCKAIDRAHDLAEADPKAFLDSRWDVRIFGTTMLEEKREVVVSGPHGSKAKAKRQFKRTIQLRKSILIAKNWSQMEMGI